MSSIENEMEIARAELRRLLPFECQIHCSQDRVWGCMTLPCSSQALYFDAPGSPQSIGSDWIILRAIEAAECDMGRWLGLADLYRSHRNKLDAEEQARELEAFITPKGDNEEPAKARKGGRL